MATSTIVFTYTVGVASGTGEKEADVTSFTVDGSAYGDLTTAEKREAWAMCKGGLTALVRDGKMSLGVGGRDTTA